VKQRRLTTRITRLQNVPKLRLFTKGWLLTEALFGGSLKLILHLYLPAIVRAILPARPLNISLRSDEVLAQNYPPIKHAKLLDISFSV
jgi:hypothetical protein